MGDKVKDKSKIHFQKFKLCSHLDELAHHGSITGDEDDPCASSWILDDESPRECSDMNSCRRFLERIVINKKTTCGLMCMLSLELGELNGKERKLREENKSPPVFWLPSANPIMPI